MFARIERWTNVSTGETHWRWISKDNITTLYGKDNNARIFDPADPNPLHPVRIFTWLICESYDDKGNVLVYTYKAEDDKGIDIGVAHERNRLTNKHFAQRYLKRIQYGNRTPRQANEDLRQRTTGCSRSCWITASTTPPTRKVSQHLWTSPEMSEHGQCAPMRSPPVVPALRCARLACAGAC